MPFIISITPLNWQWATHTNWNLNQFATVRSNVLLVHVSSPLLFCHHPNPSRAPNAVFINPIPYTLSLPTKPSYSPLFSFFQLPSSFPSSYFWITSKKPIFYNSRNPAHFARTFSFLWWRHCFPRVPLFAMNNAGANRLDSMLSYVSGRDGSQGPNLFDKGDSSWFVDDISEVGSWLMMATELVPQTSNLDSTFPVDSGKPGPFSFGV